jgi:multiple sugar transport system substrate-binding protein
MVKTQTDITLPPAPGDKVKTTPPPDLEVKQSPFRYLLPVLGVIVLIGVGFLIFTKLIHRPASTSAPTVLTYWGLWEPTTVLQSVFTQFEQANPGIKIKYEQQKSQDYRERLQTAIDNNQGPDIFRFHDTWVPMLGARLAPVPKTIFDSATYTSTFYPVAQKMLTGKSGYLGIPLEVDGLGLFYNTTIFTSAGLTPPKDWNELRRLALVLKEPKDGPLLRGGVALGTTGNVEHWADILAVMLLQNSADLAKPNNKNGQDALTFYTLFSTVDHVWDDTLPPSTYAFATEKVAMMIAPSWRAFDVQAANPNLKFAIAPLPQLPDSPAVNWASFWVEGVNSRSSTAKQTAAWKLLSYLSQKETLRTLYAAQSSVRIFGEPFSRVDMADQLTADPYVGAYISTAPTAQSWYLSSFTHDNGLNDGLIKYYEDAVNAVVGGAPATQALSTAESGIAQILTKYAVSP